jgi:hypothetical protein
MTLASWGEDVADPAHEPQSGQRPNHFFEAWPQSGQKNSLGFMPRT